MFKKFNWGHGITLFYICFVATVVTALVASFQVDHSLVTEDYYAKDLAYQSQYEKAQNSLTNKKVSIELKRETEQVEINFVDAQNKINGTVDFYRPSDKSRDFSVKLEDKVNTISTNELLQGKWILKIDWKENGESFYTEETLYI